jgi:hypothetical protein
VPGHRLSGREDGEREGPAVGQPVQDGQPEDLSVAAWREADARDPVEEVLQPGGEVLEPALGARLPGCPAGGQAAQQAIQAVCDPDEELAEDLADPVVAHGEQYRRPGHQVHGRASESGYGGDGPAANDSAGYQQQGQ